MIEKYFPKFFYNFFFNNKSWWKDIKSKAKLKGWNKFCKNLEGQFCTFNLPNYNWSEKYEKQPFIFNYYQCK